MKENTISRTQSIDKNKNKRKLNKKGKKRGEKYKNVPGNVDFQAVCHF
jgi:hypothetical protein